MEPEASPSRRPLRLAMPRPRESAWGFVASLAVHGAIVLLILFGVIGRPAATRFSGFGRGLFGGGGGGGGHPVAYIDVLPPPAASVPAPAPVPVPPVARTQAVTAPPVPEAVVQQDDSAPPAALAIARPDTGSGAGSGGGRGAVPGGGGGTGGGTGGGAGPGSGSGAGAGPGGGQGGRIQPPDLTGFAPPLDRPPRDLRGKVLKVTFSIRADGRVERYQTDPPIQDGGYRQRWDELSRTFRFRPARAPDGTPIATDYTIELVLPR